MKERDAFKLCSFPNTKTVLKCKCIRSRNVDNYLWYIKDRNIHWIDIPKSGSSSIKKRSNWSNVISKKEVPVKDENGKPTGELKIVEFKVGKPGRDSKKILKAKAAKVKETWVMIRHPKNRLESLIRFYFKSGKKWAESSRMPNLSDDQLKKYFSTPEKFLKYLRSHGRHPCLHHFFPQTEFINRIKKKHPDCEKNLNVCLLENDKTWHPDWVGMEPSKVTNKSVDLSFMESEIEEIVNTLYSADLALYNSIAKKTKNK